MGLDLKVSEVNHVMMRIKSLKPSTSKDFFGGVYTETVSTSVPKTNVYGTPNSLVSTLIKSTLSEVLFHRVFGTPVSGPKSVRLHPLKVKEISFVSIVLWVVSVNVNGMVVFLES